MKDDDKGDSNPWLDEVVHNHCHNNSFHIVKFLLDWYSWKERISKNLDHPISIQFELGGLG